MRRELEKKAYEILKWEDLTEKEVVELIRSASLEDLEELANER